MSERIPVKGLKFSARGEVLKFEGITILSFLTHESRKKLSRIQAEFFQQDFATNFYKLPQSSFHMTVMDLFCLPFRSRWPDHLQKVGDIESFCLEKLADLKFDSQDLRVKLHDQQSTGDTFRINLSPSLALDQNLKEFRSQVAGSLAYHPANLNSYQFHCTLGYKLFELPVETKYEEFINKLCISELELELQQPVLCRFENMLEFHKILEFSHKPHL